MSPCAGELVSVIAESIDELREPTRPAEPTRAQRHFRSAVRKITAMREKEQDRQRALDNGFDTVASAGVRLKAVLRDALKLFPTRNPELLRASMKNDSSSSEDSDDDDGFSDPASGGVWRSPPRRASRACVTSGRRLLGARRGQLLAHF